MECGDFLPASISAETRPPVDNCAYSSSSAGMRPARKKTTGSSSKSPSSASPVRDHAITPTLLCARRAAVWRAVSSDSSRGRRGTTARCRLFPEPSHGSPQGPFRRGGIHQRPDASAFRAVEIESPIGERTGTWISKQRQIMGRALPDQSNTTTEFPKSACTNEPGKRLKHVNSTYSGAAPSL
jgi:hypothetical protein